MTTHQLDFDSSILGIHYPAGTFHVERGTILRYCQTIGETNPIHTDEAQARASGYRDLVAPPTFCSLFLRGVARPDIKLKFGRTGFHAGEAIESLAPVLAGDTLTATVRLKEVYAKTGRSGTMVFVVWETSFDNQHSQRVVAIQDSYVRRE